MGFEAVNTWTPLTEANALPRNAIQGSATAGVGALTRNPRLISRRSLRSLVSLGRPTTNTITQITPVTVLDHVPFRTSGDTLGQLSYVLWGEYVETTWTIHDTSGTLVETESLDETGTAGETVVTAPTSLASDTVYTLTVTALSVPAQNGIIHAIALYEFL